jgi:ketosteroid isomerase-like protein
MAEVIGALDAAQVTAIRSARERHVRSILAADWGEFMKFYDEQAIVMPANIEPLDTPAKIRSFVENFPTIESFRIVNVEIDGRADLAYERGHYDMTAGGVPDRGSHFTLWRRQMDGSWKIFRDMFHTHLPVPGAN